MTKENYAAFDLPRLMEELIRLGRKERWSMTLSDPRVQHRIFRRIWEIADEIARRGMDGQEAFKTLMGHEEGYVRLRAARRVLAFAPQLALPILEDLADETQDFVGDESGSDPKTEVAYMRFSAWQILYAWRQGLPLLPLRPV